MNGKGDPQRVIRASLRVLRARLLPGLAIPALAIPALAIPALAIPALAIPAMATPPLTTMSRPAVADPQGVRLRIDQGQPPASAALDLSRFSFTTPGEAGAARGARPNLLERGFRFTPSGSADRKALSATVTSRTVGTGLEAASPQVRGAMAAAQAPGSAPSGYQVGVALEWKGLALSGQAARTDPGQALGVVDEVGLGLSYGGRRWRTGVAAAAEQGSPLPLSSALAEPERYRLQATGSILLSPAFSLSGGVRYRTTPANPSALGVNKEEEAVYVGGALAF